MNGVENVEVAVTEKQTLSVWLDDTVDAVQESELKEATNSIVVTLGGENNDHVIIRAYDWNMTDLLDASMALTQWVRDHVKGTGL